MKYQFTGEVSYDLPVGKGRQVNLNGVSNAIAGGWTVNAIAYLSTGVPINSPISGSQPVIFQSTSRHGLRSSDRRSAYRECMVQSELFRRCPRVRSFRERPRLILTTFAPEEREI